MDNTTNGTPADGMQFGYDTYGSTYFELYVADIDYAGYRADFERWNSFLLPLSPQIVTRALAPDRSSFQLGWTSVTNVFYQVQFSPDLVAWSNAGPAMKATNAITVWSDSGGGNTAATCR